MSDWRQKQNAENDALLEQIESAKVDVKETAHAVRHCPMEDCDHGYLHREELHLDRVYQVAHKHTCRKGWEGAVSNLRSAIEGYEKSTSIEEPHPLTTEMRDLARVTMRRIDDNEWLVWSQRFHRAVSDGHALSIPGDIRDFAREARER
jgi:hypothetical protein